MRRMPVMRGVLVVGLIIVLGLSRATVTTASSIAFRGGPEDHFWDVTATFCKDGFKIEANEIEHPDQTRGDNLPYMLVITTTAPLITTPMPAIIGSWAGGPGHDLASATAYYAYTTPQQFTAPISITLERWDHGDHSTVDTGEESPGDDRDSISSQAANCTLLTPPVFDEPPSPKNGAFYSVAPGQALAFPVEGSDADGIDAVTLGAANVPPGASFAIPPAANPAVTTFSWKPAANQRGRYDVQFSVTDTTGRSAPVRRVTIQVGPKEFLPLVVK